MTKYQASSVGDFSSWRRIFGKSLSESYDSKASRKKTQAAKGIAKKLFYSQRTPFPNEGVIL